MKYSLRIVFLGFLVFLPTISFGGQFKVIRIMDGHTILIKYQDTKEKIRLLYINPPESVHGDTKQNVPRGKVAWDYTRKRLSGKYIDLEFEEGRHRGTGGRLLAYVLVDGDNFNIELVRKGLTPYYTKYGPSTKYDKAFRLAEKYARKHKLNIWGDPTLTKKYLRLKSKWGQYNSATKKSRINATKVYYYGNMKLRILHKPTCIYFKCEHCKKVFYSREEAIDAGYTPCKICEP